MQRCSRLVSGAWGTMIFNPDLATSEVVEAPESTGEAVVSVEVGVPHSAVPDPPPVMSKQARANQLLPTAWDHLSSFDLAEIRAAVDTQVEMAPRKEALETALAICAILTTGHSLAELHSLKVNHITGSILSFPETPCLVRHAGVWRWVLTPGGPRSDRVSRGLSEDECHVTDRTFSFPVSDRTARLLKLLGRDKRVSNGAPVFSTTMPALIKRIEAVLKARRGETRRMIGRSATSREQCYVAAPIPRRSSCTVEALERWLTHEMIHAPGGDAALAVAVTARSERMATSSYHYGSFESTDALEPALKAVEKFDTVSTAARDPFAHLRSRHVGGTFVPSDAQVCNLARSLREECNSKRKSVFERHNALAAYTAAFLGFALGHRRTFAAPALDNGVFLPSSAAIDEATGFVRIHDKQGRPFVEARLSWVAPEAYRQIRLYEEHLDELKEWSGSCYAVIAKHEEHSPFTLPLFSAQSFVATPDSPAAKPIWEKMLERYSWVSRENAARHWLRAQLVGRCSAETINAFLGHSRAGTHPWDSDSCLYPESYLQDLKRTIPRLLQKFCWVPTEERVKAPVRPMPGRRKAVTPPSTWRRLATVEIGEEVNQFPRLSHLVDALRLDDTRSTGPDYGMGQLLASAVLNGALLDRRSWPLWVAGISDVDPETAWLWVDIQQPGGNGYTVSKGSRRWHPDHHTETLLRHWRSRWDVGELALGPEECLAHFLEENGLAGATDALARYAEFYWALRLPPLLLEHALGRSESVCVSRKNWERLLNHEPPTRGWQPPAAADNHSQGEERRSAADLWTEQKEWFSSVFRSEYAALYGPWIDYRLGRRTLASAKNECVHRLRHISSRTRGIKLLNDWACAMLKAKRKRGFRKGYSPTTVMSYYVAIVYWICQHHDGKEGGDGQILNDLASVKRKRGSLGDVMTFRQARQLDAAIHNLGGFLEARAAIALGDVTRASRHADEDLSHAPPADWKIIAEHLWSGERAKHQHDIQDLEGADGQPRDGEEAYRDLSSVAFARLISPDMYEAALAECQDAEMRLMFMFGYRVGLRMSEIVGLKVQDFHDGGERFDLCVQPHPESELKTFHSRRIIPLDILLGDDELGALRRHLKKRKAHVSASGIDPFIFGPLRSPAPYWSFDMEQRCGKVLNQAVPRSRDLHFHHLRHSFVSYLLATLLLPRVERLPEMAVPRSLRSVISLERRDRVSDRLLGAERLGRAALHAVAQLVGHMPVTTTLKSYAHLLDLSLSIYTNRPDHHVPTPAGHKAFRHYPEIPPPFPGKRKGGGSVRASRDGSAPVKAKITSYVAPILPYREIRAPVQRQTPLLAFRSDPSQSVRTRLLLQPAPLPLKRAPDWVDVHRLVCEDDLDQAIALAQELEVDSASLELWRSRYRRILTSSLRQKGRKFTLIEPQGADARRMVNDLWQMLANVPPQEQERALFDAIDRYDKRRSLWSFPSASRALEMRNLLVRADALRPQEVILLPRQEYLNKLRSTAGRAQNKKVDAFAYWGRMSDGAIERHCSDLPVHKLGQRRPPWIVLSLRLGLDESSKRLPRRWRTGQKPLAESAPHRGCRLNYAVRFALLMWAVTKEFELPKC